MQPINTALLSFGMSGQVFHAPFLDTVEGFNLYAVWERSKNTASSIYPEIKTYRTLEETLADPAVELVVVNTPNATHFAYARKALLAGKHVVVEKPFTVTSEEAEELIGLAATNNLVLSVYQNRRFDSDFKAVKKIVEEGWLGNIAEAEFHYDRFKEELSPKVHKETPGPGTGALYDLGSHLIDQALQLFGEPEAVFGDLRKVRPASLVDDYFEILLYYPALRVRLHSSYLVREALPAYQLHGSKGSFVKAKTDVQEAALQEGQRPVGSAWGKEPEAQQGLLHTENNGQVVRKLIPSPNGHYGAYYEGIAAAIRDRLTPPVTAEEGRAVIRVIERAIESHHQKRLIPF